MSRLYRVLHCVDPTRGRLHRLTGEGAPVGPPRVLTGSDTLRSARLTAGPTGEVGAGRVLVICPGRDRVLAWTLAGGGQPRAAALGLAGTLYVIDSEGTLRRVRLAQTG